MLIGDISLNGILNSNEIDYKARFEMLKDLNRHDQVIIANLESPILSKEETSKSKNPLYSFSSNLDDFLKYLSVDVFSLANNHILEYSQVGLNNTVDILNQKGVYCAGIKKESIYENILSFGKIKLGFLSYVHESTNIKYKENIDLKDLCVFNIETAINEIFLLKQQKVNLLIVSIHWGLDYSNFFTSWQEDIAHKLIDAGADVIMGHHPHTVQPIEIYKSKPIFYSLGGLCFGDFIWEGQLRALKRKTKKGIICIIDDKANIKDIIVTKDLKGNIIELTEDDIQRKLKILLWMNKLKNKNILVNCIINIKETVIDRIIEYFTGYYRHPFKQLIQISNYKKFRYILRDLITKFSR